MPNAGELAGVSCEDEGAGEQRIPLGGPAAGWGAAFIPKVEAGLRCLGSQGSSPALAVLERGDGRWEGGRFSLVVCHLLSTLVSGLMRALPKPPSPCPLGCPCFGPLNFLLKWGRFVCKHNCTDWSSGRP